ncbi:hypothetical protein [uncultured Pseudodesulfovibrio sp.]|uniref:hypothetical protein n=1 Tax=uncultured Pseudodesulfovibrio sp. TaxID=2035858 RepID=UPI0029C7AE03|nr:hypothetical protein [uncultured Pseudodesulfovibrio sp.]
MNIDSNFVTNDQGSSVSTSSDQKATRARSMKPEKLRTCADELAEELASYPDKKDRISGNYICEKFNCIRSVALEIFKLANTDVRRYFEVVEDMAQSSPLKRVKYANVGVMTGSTHFQRANENVDRPRDMRFVLGDEFNVDFPEDDWNKVILTRVRPASTTDDTVEA